MQNLKRGQISTEYVIVVSFVLFIVLTALGVALTYSAQIKDSMRFNQLDSFSNKIVTQSETILYSGAPARTTINGYFPEGVNEVIVQGFYITYNISTSSGDSVISYRSNVNLTGGFDTRSGVRIIYLNATSDSVVVSD